MLLHLPGCGPTWYSQRADAEVGVLLERYTETVLGGRADAVIYPAPEASEAAPPTPAAVAPMAAEAPGPTSASDAVDPSGGPSGGTAVPPAAAGDDTEAGAIVGSAEGAAADPPGLVPVIKADPGAGDASPPEVIVIDLERALAVAFARSRDYRAQAETLYLQGLSFTLTRYNFGPILNSTISYLWSDSEQLASTDGFNADLGVSQVLPTGGDLSIIGALGGNRQADAMPFDPSGGDLNFDTSLQVNLRQPLLRGAGYEVSHEPLTQGVRNLVYAVRSFELFRQDFAIRIASGYYNLVRQRQQLLNAEQNYLNAVEDRRRSEALRAVERIQDDDVFLARRREIEAEDQLLVARTNYEFALDDYKILLGLPTSARIAIVDEEPIFEPINIDPDSAVAAAKINRLDLHTDRDQLEDAEREVRIARNQLLPSLDLAASSGWVGDSGSFAGAAPDEWSSDLLLGLELPVNRKAERNAFRGSLIALEQERRELEGTLDEIERDILNQIRELKQIEKRLVLQEQQIARELRAVAVIRIRVESGEAQTRDLLDARQSLNDARNALIDLKVDHFIGRLQLLRDIGIFFVNERGMWEP